MNGEFCVAVHALVYLNHKDTILSSEALAENICTNPARVRKVMGKLKKANLVDTKEGIEGGYRFNKNASKVTLSMVAQALDVSFVSINWRSGSHDMACLVASGMSGIMDGILDDLNQLCSTFLQSKTIADIDLQIFG